MFTMYGIPTSLYNSASSLISVFKLKFQAQIDVIDVLSAVYFNIHN